MNARLLLALSLALACREATHGKQSTPTPDAGADALPAPTPDARAGVDRWSGCAGCSYYSKCAGPRDPCSCLCAEGMVEGDYVCRGGCLEPLPDAAAGDGPSDSRPPSDLSTADATGDVPPAVGCPQRPPVAGDPCVLSASCRYYDCAGAGRTTASCDGSRWNVRSQACAAFRCDTGPCAPGEICVLFASGAILPRCVANPCGSGPITCACARTVCNAADCHEGGELQAGTDLTCSYRCTTPPCPP